MLYCFCFYFYRFAFNFTVLRLPYCFSFCKIAFTILLLIALNKGSSLNKGSQFQHTRILDFSNFRILCSNQVFDYSIPQYGEM